MCLPGSQGEDEYNRHPYYDRTKCILISWNVIKQDIFCRRGISTFDNFTSLICVYLCMCGLVCVRVVYAESSNKLGSLLNCIK